MEEEWAREPAGLDGIPPMYSILKGEVVSVTTYGAFVKIAGYKKQGLVHKSEMSACRVDNPSEIVDVGEQVWIKVIGTEMKDDKNQTVLLYEICQSRHWPGPRPQQRHGRTGRASPETVQRLRQAENHIGGCAQHHMQKVWLHWYETPGHFAKDCFSTPGLQYSLVPEEEEEPTSNQNTQSEPQKRKKEKKAKKEKKKKKEKEKKRESSSSDSGAEDAKRPKHSHAHSDKKKKHKKHKHKAK